MTLEAFNLVVATFLLLNMLGGLFRVLIGPEAGDRMLAAQLFGTVGVGILLLLSFGLKIPALQDVALVLALLAVINVGVFVRYARESNARQ